MTATARQQAAWAALAEVSDPELPAPTPFFSTGSQGLHSEHLGFILAEMQALQRQHPGGRW